jgi:hypothetical protein
LRLRHWRRQPNLTEKQHEQYAVERFSFSHN